MIESMGVATTTVILCIMATVARVEHLETPFLDITLTIMAIGFGLISIALMITAAAYYIKEAIGE